MNLIKISDDEKRLVLAMSEGHFCDFKSIRISPAKLTRTISAFANADGGEIYVGIEDKSKSWDGFESMEHANGHIQIFDKLFPMGHGFEYSFLTNENSTGVILKIEILKSQNITFASNQVAYLRRSAQNIPQEEGSALERLKRNKGITSFETSLINIDKEIVLESDATSMFIDSVIPATNPEKWLKKQRMIIDDRPTAAGVILFSDEPQAIIPKQCGLKLYRYQTKEEEGGRAVLVFDPISIEGNAYNVIKKGVAETAKVIEGIRLMTPDGLQSAKYPKEALHEIVTNAVLHRDYSVPDDIHIRVFDNRVEIQSPGLLPAHITEENILDERFSRNGAIVRLINKFPNPPNKDVGEGLNTAFAAMQTMRLKDPEIKQSGMNVIVTLKHESLGSPEELIIQFLSSHDRITNKQARDICNVGSENAMKHILRKMVEAKMLVVNKGKTVFQTSYSLA